MVTFSVNNITILYTSLLCVHGTLAKFQLTIHMQVCSCIWSLSNQLMCGALLIVITLWKHFKSWSVVSAVILFWSLCDFVWALGLVWFYKPHWYFGGKCIDSVDHFKEYNIFKNTNLLIYKERSCSIIYTFKFFSTGFVIFSICIFQYLVKFTAKYFMVLKNKIVNFAFNLVIIMRIIFKSCSFLLDL